ncbi:MAG: hypothetical protein ABFS16_00885 [Bacteroidota bacterium]
MPVKLFDKKVNLVGLIILVHLIFSYYYIPKFWSAAVGFVLILLLSYLAWENRFIFWTGFQLKPIEIFFSIFLAALFLKGALYLIKNIATQNEILFQPGNYKDLIHTFFYTLNEEIILGALLLKGIQHKWKKLAVWKISMGVALIFSIIHFVFFKWIFLNTGDLSVITILSLLATGILRNNIILKTGHIGYSWAIHFGWIFPMLGCSHLKLTGKNYLTDFERFNLYLGDYKIAIFVSLLAIISFFILNKKTATSS